MSGPPPAELVTGLAPAGLRHHPLFRVVDELLRLEGRLATLFAASAVLGELSRLEATVLAAIVEAPTPPTVPRIGRSLGHPRQVIQRAVDRLAARGLVARRPNPDHRRAPLLVATERALAARRETVARALAMAEAFLARWDGARLAALGDELEALRRALECFARDAGGEAGG